MIDPAMIRTIGFRVSDDKGRMLENTVFLHLKMHGREVYFHQGQKECDFVIRENNQITQAIQVTSSFSDKKVRNREISGLVEAMNTYSLAEGLIITENDEEQLTIDDHTVKIIPIWKWLLGLS